MGAKRDYYPPREEIVRDLRALASDYLKESERWTNSVHTGDDLKRAAVQFRVTAELVHQSTYDREIGIAWIVAGRSLLYRVEEAAKIVLKGFDD